MKTDKKTDTPKIVFRWKPKMDDSLFGDATDESEISFLKNESSPEAGINSEDKNITCYVSMTAVNEEGSECTIGIRGPTMRPNLLDHAEGEKKREPVKSYQLSICTNSDIRDKPTSVHLTFEETKLLHRVLKAHLALADPNFL